jgi:hypothetical protein
MQTSDPSFPRIGRQGPWTECVVSRGAKRELTRIRPPRGGYGQGAEIGPAELFPFPDPSPCRLGPTGQ